MRSLSGILTLFVLSVLSVFKCHYAYSESTQIKVLLTNMSDNCMHYSLKGKIWRDDSLPVGQSVLFDSIQASQTICIYPMGENLDILSTRSLEPLCYEITVKDVEQAKINNGTLSLFLFVHDDSLQITKPIAAKASSSKSWSILYKIFMRLLYFNLSSRIGYSLNNFIEELAQKEEEKESKEALERASRAQPKLELKQQNFLIA